MKCIAILAALLTTAVAVSAEVTSADLRRCPDGHSTLKDVPISYGLPDDSPEARKEMKRQIENLEVVLGGCEVDDTSPRVMPTCTTCRFTFNSASDTWSRSSHDIHSFKRPFSPLLRSFPVLARTKTLDYVQRLQSDIIVSEEVAYTATQDHPEFAAEIDKWFAAHGIVATYTPSTNTENIVREWHAPGITIRFSYDSAEAFVWLTRDLAPPKP